MSEPVEQPPTPVTAIAKVEAALEARRGNIETLLPSWLHGQRAAAAARIIQAARLAVAREPNLLRCTPQSIVVAVQDLAELGLVAGGPGREAYLVPYGDKCTPIVGYLGLLKLAHQSMAIKSIVANVVYERDEFDYLEGSNPWLTHKPAVFAEDRGAILGAYALAVLVSGGVQFEIMSLAALYAIRDRSRAKNSGPWRTDETEMMRKTVVRRLYKYLPKSPSMDGAYGMDEDAEDRAPMPLASEGALQAFVDREEMRK